MIFVKKFWARLGFIDLSLGLMVDAQWSYYPHPLSPRSTYLYGAMMPNWLAS